LCSSSINDRTTTGPLWYDVEGASHNRVPRFHYVYGWYEEGASLPFYIGQGTGRRAWERHERDAFGSINAPCEQVRSSSTRVVIYAQSLTAEGALLVEAVLIRLFTGNARRIRAHPQAKMLVEFGPTPNNFL
jgi:hypothetical protein